jgi:hypothetical protein
MTQPSRRSEPGAVGRLVLSLRPAITDLFAGYAVPAEAASGMLREAVELLIVHCERTAEPRRFFLHTLEERCAAYAEAQTPEPDGRGGER